MKKLMKDFKIINHKIDVKFKTIAKVTDAKIKKQDKKFANICFAKIISFIKNNILLIR